MHIVKAYFINDSKVIKMKKLITALKHLIKIALDNRKKKLYITPYLCTVQANQTFASAFIMTFVEQIRCRILTSKTLLNTLHLHNRTILVGIWNQLALRIIWNKIPITHTETQSSLFLLSRINTSITQSTVQALSFLQITTLQTH